VFYILFGLEALLGWAKILIAPVAGDGTEFRAPCHNMGLIPMRGVWMGADTALHTGSADVSLTL